MFINDRINDIIDNMSIEEKYKILDQFETKNLGYNEKEDKNFIESIVNILLDITTLLAKIIHII